MDQNEKAEKVKIRHDFSNSMVIINRMAKSASCFAEKISESCGDNTITPRQIELFKQAMKAIQGEASKVEKLFYKLLEG